MRVGTGDSRARFEQACFGRLARCGASYIEEAEIEYQEIDLPA